MFVITTAGRYFCFEFSLLLRAAHSGAPIPTERLEPRHCVGRNAGAVPEDKKLAPARRGLDRHQSRCSPSLWLTFLAAMTTATRCLRSYRSPRKTRSHKSSVLKASCGLQAKTFSMVISISPAAHWLVV